MTVKVYILPLPMFSDKDDNNADNDAALSLLLDDAVTNVPSSHRSSNYIPDASDSIFVPNEFAGKTPKTSCIIARSQHQRQ